MQTSESISFQLSLSTNPEFAGNVILDCLNSEGNTIKKLKSDDCDRSTLFNVKVPAETTRIVAYVCDVMADVWAAPFKNENSFEVKTATSVWYYECLQATFEIRELS